VRGEGGLGGYLAKRRGVDRWKSLRDYLHMGRFFEAPQPTIISIWLEELRVFSSSKTVRLELSDDCKPTVSYWKMAEPDPTDEICYTPSNLMSSDW